jgi:hypothetical protein
LGFLGEADINFSTFINFWGRIKIPECPKVFEDQDISSSQTFLAEMQFLKPI